MTLPRDRERDLERLLGDDGGEFGMLYRRLPRAEPPRRLDRAVLGEAARAVRGQTPRRHRWMVGLGSAAGIVLAAGIAWHVGQDALREPPYQSGHVGPIVVPVEPITPSTRGRRERANELPNAAANLPTPMPPEPEAPAKPARPELARKAIAKPAPPALVRPVAPPAAPPPPTPFPAESAQREQGPQAAPAAAAAARSPASAPAAKSAQASDALDQAVPQRIRGSGPSSPSSSIELRRDLQLAPDDWLAHIQQLLRQGRRQQAVESLRLFRSAHPQRQLPDELQALLE